MVTGADLYGVEYEVNFYYQLKFTFIYIVYFFLITSFEFPLYWFNCSCDVMVRRLSYRQNTFSSNSTFKTELRKNAVKFRLTAFANKMTQSLKEIRKG